MITAVVGRTFLDAYNIKYNKLLSPKEFFVQEYFELFYNHSKYMQWVTNSPFVQGITTSDDGFYGKELKKLKSKEEDLLKKTVLELQISYSADRISIKTDKSKGITKILLKNDEIQRKERLGKLIELIVENRTDGSVALGFPAADDEGFASTSGLVSDLIIPVSNDDVYLSWIGSGLGIGVAGGYSILFDDAETSLGVYEGWKVYRKLLKDSSIDKLKGNQINTWNGQWLSFYFGNDFEESFDFGILENLKFFKLTESLIEIDTINWSRLYFSLSRKLPEDILNAYVYSLGDINKTIGFIPFQLKSGSKLKNIYKQLTGNNSSISTRDFESLFGMHIKRACELGSIGLQTLRPEGLVKYMKESKNLNLSKEEDKINYYVFKTWLIAMLNKNKEEVTEYTLKLAETILRYRNSGTKNDRKNLVEKELFESKSKKGFIEHLTTMVRDLDPDDLLLIKNFKDEIHLMTNEEFGYFSTLLKFDYAFLEKQS